ncbi:MAG: hypothetical protein QOH82_3130, partial [Mycobacterium sp.]|nr:hypothetical protein [Mycobacterium sp.]
VSATSGGKVGSGHVATPDVEVVESGEFVAAGVDDCVDINAHATAMTISAQSATTVKLRRLSGAARCRGVTAPAG